MLNYLDLINEHEILIVLVPVAILLMIDAVGRLLQFALLDLPESRAEDGLSRWYQNHRLGKVRLGRLIASQGVRSAAYQRNLTVAQLKSQIDACCRCSATAQCDALSRNELSRGQGLEFCPNSAALRDLRPAP